MNGDSKNQNCQPPSNTRDDDPSLSPEPQAELRHRLADPNPAFATEEQVTAVFRRFVC